MATGEVRVSIRANTRLVIPWLHMCRLLAYVIGPDRAYRLGMWGGRRLVLFKIDNGRWRSL